MEECDALSTRLAIMVDGEFRCLGTPQHLKNKFGKGYLLKVKAPFEDTCTIGSVKQFMTDSFFNCTLVHEYHCQFAYNIPCESINWSALFHHMENAKYENAIVDYSVSQPRLEDIYIDIARDHWNRRSLTMDSGSRVLPQGWNKNES